MDSATHITHFAFFKNLSYVAAFIATVEYLGFSPETTGIFVVLMIIDVITGTTRAAVVEGRRSIRSSVWTRGILAKVMLMTAIFSVAITGKAVGIEATSLANAAINVLILSELYSILGNIHSIKTGKPKSEFDAVAFILGRVKSLLEKSLK